MSPELQATGASPLGPTTGDDAALASARLQRTLRELTRRSFVAVFLGTTFRWIAGVGLFLGALVLLVRTVFWIEPSPGWMCALPVAIGVAWGLRGARRRALTRAQAATWVDVHAGGSGLIVTGLETEDRRWSAAFDAALGQRVQLPELRIGGPLQSALGGMAVLALALFVRIPQPSPGPSPEFVRALTETLTDKFHALTENVRLGDELLEEFSSRLDRLTELAEDAPTESLFEALDRLSDRFDAEGARSGALAEEALESLFGGLDTDDLSSPVARSALETALRLLREGGLDSGLPAALEELLGEDLTLPPGLELDAARWSEIAGQLAEHLEGSFDELAQAGLVELAQKGLASRFAEFGELLSEEGGALGLLGALGSLGQTGQGGSEQPDAQGGGSAEPLWGREASDLGAQFESALLSPAEFLDAEHSGVVGHATRRPGDEFWDVKAVEESAGLVEVQASAGRSAWRRRLAPRHRNAVRAFFGAQETSATQRSSNTLKKDGRR